MPYLQFDMTIYVMQKAARIAQEMQIDQNLSTFCIASKRMLYNTYSLFHTLTSSVLLSVFLRESVRLVFFTNHHSQSRTAALATDFFSGPLLATIGKHYCIGSASIERWLERTLMGKLQSKSNLSFRGILLLHF